MPSPPIQLFLTTIASAPALRQKQEYLLRILQVKRIAFVSYDLASDENAKRLWKRRAPKEHQSLPGMLIGGRWRGGFEQFEEAVERGELETFLLLNEDYDPDLDGKVLAAGPIGVPGAAMPLQMQGHKPSFAPTGPTPMKKSGEPGTGDEMVDAGDVLPGYGFQGLKVTVNELADLAKELGLNDKKTEDLEESEPSKAGTSQSNAQPAESQDTPTGKTEKDEETKETSTGSEDKPTSAPPETPTVATEEGEDISPDNETAREAETAERVGAKEEKASVAPLKLGKPPQVEES